MSDEWGARWGVDVVDLCDRMDEAVTIHDHDGRFVYLNPAAVRAVGVPADQLIGTLPWALAPTAPADSPFRVALEAVLAGAPSKKVTTFVPWRARWFAFDIYAHRGGAFVMSRDVTAARRAHDDLANSEARFRAMVETSPEAIVIFDATAGRFTDLNPEAEKLFGRTRAELLGVGPLDVCQPTQAGGVPTAVMVADVIEKVLRDEIADLDVAIIGPRGLPLTVELHARRLPSTEPALIRASMFDITTRKHAQDQLAQIQRLEATARLAGGVAHDFNNMLTVIIGGTQLALNALPQDHPVREDLRDVMSAAERAALITRQLLAFGRRQHALPRVVDLTTYVDRMKPVLQRMVGADAEIDLELARPLGGTFIDPAHVEQILINLVANARDAMPRGGRITIHTANVILDREYQRLHNGVPPGRYVLLSVSDTGEGIPEAVKPHIFEPFFTTKALERGTGLGLATVHGSVKHNGGHICVYSEPGLGATFKIYLPLASERTGAEPEAAAEAPRPSNAGTETILVVEDDDEVRAFLRRALQRHGYSVLETNNAGEALLLCEQHEGKIDLLLTDVVMPRMTGPQLAARLRALRPDMRIIYISGYSEERIDGPEYAAIRDGFIAKPMSVDALLQCVRSVLDR